ncbi:ferritin-like domain-containing protein [Clavibacter capsici]|uniref:ferritin-like domain-containing protein n=1 Tax=Clavibacter capsici TaxID=1874630 RepID=UPI00293E7450|nr:ferritin-like domain-containing protein [Clavibacter capsici]
MTSITQTPTPARPTAAIARMGTAADWIAHFHANAERHLTPEELIPTGTPSPMDARTRRAFVRSFQRFALGESGDGGHLLRMATAAGDPAYTHALALLVQEEQKHAALFVRALDHLDAPPLPAHWTDAAFTRLRHLIGLRTKISLFLIAETVATGYFHALAEHAPDPALRSLGRRIADDERDHVRFQIDRLRTGFRDTPAPLRALIGAAWTVVAAGAATVIVVDHRAALRACGVAPRAYWRQAMRGFGDAARSVLVDPQAPLVGPTDAAK